MKEITLKIPNSKLRFFMELINQLGIEVTNGNTSIPKKHQDIVLDRIKNTKEKDLLNWDEIKDDFDGI